MGLLQSSRESEFNLGKGAHMNRSEINRALAKAIAYKQCGQDAKAAAWAAQLVRELGYANILDTEGDFGGWRKAWHDMQVTGDA